MSLWLQKGWRKRDPGGREQEGKDKGREQGPQLSSLSTVEGFVRIK